MTTGIATVLKPHTRDLGDFKSESAKWAKVVKKANIKID